jgi:hypothetical protein
MLPLVNWRRVSPNESRFAHSRSVPVVTGVARLATTEALASLARATGAGILAADEGFERIAEWTRRVSESSMTAYARTPAR